APYTTPPPPPPAPSTPSLPGALPTSTEAGSTFQCALDGGGFAPCASPQTYSALAGGNHTFQVRATDPAGNTDPTPASFTWTVDRVEEHTTVPQSRSDLACSVMLNFTF